MFDANMRHLPEGTKFFAREEDDKKNPLLYCVMLGSDSKGKRVVSHSLCGNQVKVKSLYDTEDDKPFYVYQGQGNGEGFICGETKEEAIKLLSNLFEAVYYEDDGDFYE